MVFSQVLMYLGAVSSADSHFQLEFISDFFFLMHLDFHNLDISGK